MLTEDKQLIKELSLKMFGATSRWQKLLGQKVPQADGTVKYLLHGEDVLAFLQDLEQKRIELEAQKQQQEAVDKVGALGSGSAV